MKTPRGARAGFTLAEVAITLLIVSIGLVLVLQGLTTSKISAVETHYRKVARQLAQLTLGRVESGLFWEDLHGTTGEVQSGSYAEEGYEDFTYEIVFGDEQFREDDERYGRGDTGYHDSWEYERQREERADKSSTKKDEEEVEKPFEKVRIKVYYPKLGERPNSLVLERWMPWTQVYGESDDKNSSKSGSSSGSGSGGSGSP